MNNVFGIVMTTYYRKNGTSLQKITRAINSIKNQTYKNWKLFLIGDHYEDEQEFKQICSQLPAEKITAINLPIAVEREDARFDRHTLWCSAGANASNVGIEQTIRENILIHCHIDDDDEWLPFHLEILNIAYTNYPESVFVYTNAFYRDRTGYIRLFPEDNVPKLMQYNNLPPRPERLIHSTVSWRLNKIPFRHRNSIEQGRAYPGDADMWERINKYCVDNNLRTLYVPLTTVMKYDEAEMLK
jgi:glycosyltransferase involved in cell wall biosynthesis